MEINNSTFGTHNSFNKMNNKNFNHLSEINTKISTGNQYRGFDEMSKDLKVTSYINLKQEIDINNSFINSNQHVISKIESYDSILSKIIENTSEIRSLISSYSGKDNIEIIKSNINDNIDNIVNYLNTNINGDYLFSGNIDTLPVDNPTLENIKDSSYYKGSGNNNIIYIDAKQKLSYGLNAGMKEFQNLLLNLHEIKNNFNNNDNDLIIKLNESLDELTHLQGKELHKIKRLENKNSELSDNNLTLGSHMSKIKNADITELTAEQHEYSSLLNVGFNMVAKMYSLQNSMLKLLSK